MLEGPVLLIILVAAIGLIILATSWLKIHPFLSLLLAAIGLGLAVRMPLDQIIQAITSGFGGLMAYIGLIIVFGTIIGTILEKSGGAIKMADVVLNLVGRRSPSLAMSLIGALVSIPVFCDSGFVILSRLNKAVARRSGTPLATMTIALSSGLYATHTLVPPTPGPIAAAGNIGASDYLGTVIWVGLLTALPVMAIGYFWAQWIGRSIVIEGEHEEAPQPETLQLPSAIQSFTPILLPILLIAVASVTRLYGWSGPLARGLLFVGHPLMALFIGMLFTLTLMPRFDEEHLTGWVGKGIMQAGPILLITGAGGAFGSVLKATPLTQLITGIVNNGQVSGIVFLLIAFSIAAAIKSSQGSSTAALVITSSLLGPFLPVLGIQSAVGMALVVMAIGSGAMTVSHVNDSYFWVVTQFSGMRLDQAYRAFTTVTLLQGLTGLGMTLFLWVLLT